MCLMFRLTNIVLYEQIHAAYEQVDSSVESPFDSIIINGTINDTIFLAVYKFSTIRLNFKQYPVILPPKMKGEMSRTGELALKTILIWMTIIDLKMIRSLNLIIIRK